MKAVILRALEADDKAACVRRAIHCPDEAEGRQRFEVDISSFKEVPRSPFAYWVSEQVRQIFAEFPPFQMDGRIAAIGASTKDDFRYVRLATEITPSQIAMNRKATHLQRWVLFSKGGAFSQYYADVYLTVNWKNDGRELKADISEYRGERGWGYQWSAALNGHSSYFRAGLTWPRRTQAGLSLRAMPSGCIFADKGPAAFVEGDDIADLLTLLAITNTRAFRALVDLQMAFGSYEAGVIQRTPIPHLKPSDRAELAAFARSAWSLKQSLDTHAEASHAFVLPALLLVGGKTFAARTRAWTEKARAVDAELATIQAEIDAGCFSLYNINEADQRAIVEGFDAGGEAGAADSSPDGDADDAGDDGSEVGALDPAELAAGLVSWAVGVAVGRFDLRLATGERSAAKELDPFDPLPRCLLGMLTGDDGLPLVTNPPGYGVEVSSALVDDPGHRLDITARVRAVLDVVFGTEADSWWADLGVALGAKTGEVGGWLGRGFFDYHLKTYSKSRRKAPILWPIGTLSGSYVVWLHAHRVSADSLFQILNDIVVPKLQVEERELTQLRQEAGTDPTASQRKAIDARERFVAELHEFREELEAVAPLWSSDLDDGVVVTLAPMWRLFAHHRAWSNELKRHWARLAKGDYDWAQLAMRLWPGRVVPKCAEDRSLAIAHGLEDAFWVQDPDNEDKSLPRQIPATPIDQVIAQRQNLAATAALQRVNT